MKPIGTFAAVVAVFLGAFSAAAEEPAREFLEGLRERGYHDTALDYLDWIAGSKLAPIELKETLKYEKAVTLIALSRGQRDKDIRGQQLDQAQQLLDQFIKERPQHARVNAARSQLGNLIIERARILVVTDPGNRSQLKEARDLYGEATQVFTQLQASVREQLEKIPKVLDVSDPEQAKLAERRTQLRADYLDTLIRAAAIREETADAVEKDSAEYKQLLGDAAAQYEDIYKRYRTRIAGLFARMYQGRANQKLGKLRDALGFYVELLDQPDEPEAFRQLKTETIKLAMECWLDKSAQKYLEAIRRGSEWVAKARANEDRHPDWLYLRLMLAQAYMMQAEDVKEKDPRETRTINFSLAEARKLANMVARYDSDYQQQAREMVALLGGPDRTGEKPQPQNFVQGRKAGTDALEDVETSRVAVKELAQKLASEKDAQKKAELQKQLDESRLALAASMDDAVHYLRLALTMADSDTSIEDVNLVRYFLCYLYYLREDYYESALMGEFVARRYADSAGASACAEIAMACYLLLHAQSEAEEREFETNRVVSIAEYIVGKWPASSQSEKALAALIPFMINAGQLDKARTFLAKIPPDSGNRTEAELKVGRAVWQTYLQDLQKFRESQEQLAEDELAALRAELDELKTVAPQILAAAYGRLQPGTPVDVALLTSNLSLAQAYVENQQADKAIEVLLHENFGPLALVRKDHAATKGAGFAEECYRTALRGYIGALTTASDPDATIQAARQIMDELKAAVGDTAEGQNRLISVYVALAQDLEAQLKAATPEARQALSKGFETFLTQLSAGATDLNVLNWVAETFASLGSGFDTGDSLTAEANRYYDQSVAAFQNILDKVQLTPQMRTQVELRLAGVRRQQRKFKDALELLGGILQQNNTALNVQVDAAKTLQQWADLSGDDFKAQLYEKAIQGDLPDPQTQKNVVWGWGKVAQITARYPQYKDAFHEARLNLALCRYLWAESQGGAERSRLLGLAEKDISLTSRLYGLGGDKWRPQYDALLKRIQRSKGETPVGVEALDVPAGG